MKPFAITAFPTTVAVSAVILAGPVTAVPTYDYVNAPLARFHYLGYAPVSLPPAIGLASSAETVMEAHGLGVTMAAIKNANRPWSRRLVKLDASQRLGSADLATMVAILTLSDLERWPTPGIFPGEDGGLRIEWHNDGRRTTYEIDDEGAKFAYWNDPDLHLQAVSEPEDFNEAASFLRLYLHG